MKTSWFSSFEKFENRYLPKTKEIFGPSLFETLNFNQYYFIVRQLNRFINDLRNDLRKQNKQEEDLSDNDQELLKKLVARMNTERSLNGKEIFNFVIVENPLSVKIDYSNLEEYHSKIMRSKVDKTICDELNFLIGNLVKSESLVQKELQALIKKPNNRDSIKSQKQKLIVEKDNDQLRVKLVPRSWRDHADKVIAASLVSSLATGLGLYFGASGFSLFGAGTASATAFTVGSAGVSFGVLSAAIIGVGAGLAIAAVCVSAYHYYEKGNKNTFSVDDQSIDDDTVDSANSTHYPYNFGHTFISVDAGKETSFSEQPYELKLDLTCPFFTLG